MATTKITKAATAEIDHGLIGGGLEGDFGSEDLQTPYLKILQPNSNSDLKRDHEGEFAIESLKLALGEEIKVIVITMRKLWQEVLSDADRKADPSRFPTIFVNKQAGLEACVEVTACAELDLAIVREKDESGYDTAMVKHEDVGLVMARYTVTGRSYKLAKSVFTASRMAGDSHISDHYFMFQAVEKPAFNMPYRVPMSSMGEAVPKDLQKKILESIG